MAWDITSTIIEYYLDLFTREMQTNIVSADILRLKNIFELPQQFDPTLEAPYLIVGQDTQYGRVPDPEHPMDVGGPVRWMNFFVVKGRIPRRSDRVTARRHIGILNQRAVGVLARHYHLDYVTADDGESARNNVLGQIRKNITHPIGGETEWYAEFGIWFYVYTEESAEMSDTPGAVYY